MKPHALVAIIVLAACKTPAAAEKPPAAAAEKAPAIDQAAVVSALTQKFGEPARARAERGVRQGAAFWRAADGDAGALKSFALESFATDPEPLFQRFSAPLGQVDGPNPPTGPPRHGWGP